VAYTPETWVDRNVERPNTYTEVVNGDGTKTIIPSPGTVVEAGTTVTAQRMNKIEQGIVNAMPAGGIIMWSGSIATIPSTWALCDGANGTPDLRDRFVVCAGSGYAPGDIGGANTVTLTSEQMPSHGHSVSGTAETAGAHTHTVDAGSANAGDPYFAASDSGAQYWTNVVVPSAGSHTHTVSGTAANTGGGSSHENRPPYYALAYIMKL